MSFFNLFPNRLFVAHSLQPDSFTQAHFSEMHKLAAMKSEITPEFKVFWCTTRFYFGSSLMTCLFFYLFPNILFVAHSLQPDSFTQAHFSEMHKLAAMKSEITPEFKVFWCTTRFYFGSSLMTCLFFFNFFPNRLFVAHSLQPDSFTQALFSEMHKLAANKSGILAKFLQPLLIHHKVPSLVLSNKVTRATGNINEPVGGSDNPLRFTAGLALSVFMDCELENVQDLQRVQVQVSSALCK